MNKKLYTITSALTETIRLLEGCSTTPILDSEVLLSFVLQKPTSFLLSHSEYELTDIEYTQFKKNITKRKTGMPIAYIHHQKEFYGRTFYVDERVLIPRPETELLIEEVLRYVQNQRPREASSPLRILDIGTGSGCIAVTLKKELPSAQVIATDISTQALEVATYNAQLIDADIQFQQGNLFNALLAGDAVGGIPLPAVYEDNGIRRRQDPRVKFMQFDIIVSNPPYVDMNTLDINTKESASLRFEPQNALKPTEGDALSIITSIIQQAPIWLKPQGALFIEIGENQGAQAQLLAQKKFPQKNIAIIQDLARLPRLLSIQ